MSTFQRLFEPRGIAIVGASGDLTRMAGQTVRALNHHGYPGGVYPVNPKYAEIGGRRCYAAIDQIDGDCDVAVIALPAAQVPGIIAQCGQRGIGHAVVLSGGFREIGDEGAQREAAMLVAARAHGVRIIGPNCIGAVNVHARVYAAFASVTRAPELKPGCVSAVVQSGGFGMTMIIRCALAGIGFRYVVASGGEADVSAPELIDAYVDDPETRLILAYIEGVADGRALMAVARRALRSRKPLILWKGGKTAQGARAAASHTANLTSSYDVYRAALRQCAVIEVSEMDQVVDGIQCLLGVRRPAGRNVAVVGNTGGCAVAFCDTADQVGLNLPRPAEATKAELTTFLPPLSALDNPIDYTAGRPRPEDAANFLRAFRAILADPGVDQLAAMFGTVVGGPFELGSRLLVEASAGSDKPVFVFSAVPEEISSAGWDSLRAAGIPILPTPMRVARAMGMLADYAEAARLAREASACAAADFALPRLPAGAKVLNEHESKQLMAAAGIAVTQDVLLPLSLQPPALQGIAYPVALKIVSRDIAHKSDIGAVRLDIRSAEELIAAAADIVSAARRNAPDARLDGLLACPMLAEGVEMIVGVVNDAAFGPVVALGMGGLLAETIRDVSYRVAPFGIADAHAMMAELRGRAVLQGTRGNPPCDLAALAQVVVAVSRLAWQMRDRIAELDINPLFVGARGLGAVAADALVVMR